ncbi:MAG: hypothetical protein EHM28_07440 [Spirochaetaceae bacterium]|nr:MAG: hypothetical protein EHM28_07440 [Spirochaetaceae bacterium]
MINKAFKRILIVFLLLLSGALAFGQMIPKMEFSNAEITDILVALSSATGKSILPDETIKGTATYSFQDKMEFASAFEIFLSTYKMYYRIENNIYYVSRISASVNREKNTITMDAEDVDVALLIRAASKSFNITVIDESLPTGKLTVHAREMAPEAFFSMLLSKFQGFAVEKKTDYYLIRRLPVESSGNTPLAQGLTMRGDHFTLNVQKIRFKDLIIALFQKAGFEYSNLSRKDQILEDLRFADKTFEEMLGLVLEQMSMDFRKVGNVYYLFEITQQDVMKKLNLTEIIRLSCISTQDFQKLLPSQLASSKLYKLDEANSVIILTGSDEEIAPLREFISQIDKPLHNMQYQLFTLSFLDVKNIKAILPAAFKGIEPVIVPGTSSFVMLLSPEKKKLLEDFLSAADRRPDTRFVKLRYIKAEDLLKTLPPSVSKESITATADSSGVFFSGSEEQYKAFIRDLSMIDQPIPQIQYKLLVVLYQRKKSFEYGLDTEVTSPQPTTGDDAGKALAFVGNFSEILSLNFDIIGSLGYFFATNMSMDLKNSLARVFADTTLNGISGQEVKLQNTETSRYRNVTTSSETTSTYTTSEINSGLILSIKGWVSGNGMITMTVAATVSKQTASDKENQLPSTTEKVINTQVRTRCGEPIVIGGLIYQDVNENISKVPLLGDIPLVGYLFQNTTLSYETTEMVIYIVPMLEYTADNHTTASTTIQRIYDNHVAAMALNISE